MKNQRGQIILVLILVMTVTLAIGLSIVQKSLTDVSTASKVEQSSRAFSAAEAGVEQTLTRGVNCTGSGCRSFAENNSSIKEIVDSGLIPNTPSVGTRQVALEFPPLAKEDIVQVWLADLNSPSNPPADFYKQTTLDIYWGNSATDRAAIEVTLVSFENGSYKSTKWYLDQIQRNNGFTQVTSCGGYSVGNNTYQCRETLTGLPTSGAMLLRARLLYNTTSQPFAVWVPAASTCGSPCSLPPQARSITSTGIAGETQRSVNVFQLDKVVPSYFDYAIFSAGEISK